MLLYLSNNGLAWVIFLSFSIHMLSWLVKKVVLIRLGPRSARTRHDAYWHGQDRILNGFHIITSLNLEQVIFVSAANTSFPLLCFSFPSVFFLPSFVLNFWGQGTVMTVYLWWLGLRNLKDIKWSKRHLGFDLGYLGCDYWEGLLRPDLYWMKWPLLFFFFSSQETWI